MRVRSGTVNQTRLDLHGLNNNNNHQMALHCCTLAQRDTEHARADDPFQTAGLLRMQIEH